MHAGAAHSVGTNEQTPAGTKARTFDWSLVDWTADDPFAVACAAVSEGAPAGEACERRALDALRLLLSRRRAALAPALSTTAAASALGEVGSLRREMAREYILGQQSLLEGACAAVDRLVAALPTPHNEMAPMDGGQHEEVMHGAKRARHDAGSRRR